MIIFETYGDALTKVNLTKILHYTPPPLKIGKIENRGLNMFFFPQEQLFWVKKLLNKSH